MRANHHAGARTCILAWATYAGASARHSAMRVRVSAVTSTSLSWCSIAISSALTNMVPTSPGATLKDQRAVVVPAVRHGALFVPLVLQ